MQTISQDIIEINSPLKGPAVAIFVGVHGNETAGVLALQEITPTISIKRGTLFLVYANPPAIKANVRMINKNLNRCFYKENEGQDQEDIRARELMKILDQCDALLDIHMFYDEDGLPFIICEEASIEVAQIFDVDIISTNWTQVEPGGTDGYMHLNGKIGICLECGPISKADFYKDHAKQAIYQFLKYFELIEYPVAFSNQPKRLVQANEAIMKASESFQLAKGLHNFDLLEEGQIIATEGSKEFTAKANECIIFPHYKARVNEESYIIGEVLG